MGRLWKENPLKLALKFLVNLVYGVSIFGVFLITFVNNDFVKVLIPPEYFGYLSVLFVIFQTLKNALEKIDPKLKESKKDVKPSRSIKMD